jgi:hypothetical protein
MFASFSCSRESGTDVYDFLSNTAKAQVKTPTPNYVNLGRPEFTINNDKRVGFFEHPNSEITFEDVPIGSNAVLTFGIGVLPAVWDKPGDGVWFEIVVVDSNSDKSGLFSKYIDPKKNASERKWHDYQLSLAAYDGKKVTFIFKTNIGPNENDQFDWAAWSTPQIKTAQQPGLLGRLLSILGVS